MAKDADEERVFTPSGSGVHQGDERRKMDIRGLLLGAAEAAGEVPIIASWRQRRAALAGDIFAHRVLARFEQAVAVAVGNIKLKALFHTAPIKVEKPKNLAGNVGVGHRQRRHIDDAAHRRAGGQDVHGLSRAEQDRPDGNIAAGCGFEQVVGDIGRVDIGQD